MTQIDLHRFHSSCRMIEDDLDEAYYSCREKFGADVAGVILVALLRQKFNDGSQWPPKAEVIEKTNEFLRDKGILNDRK